jgi:hypothetical protein
VTQISCKESVRFKHFHAKIGVVLDIAREVWESYGIDDCVVTSLNDSVHSRTSLHYAGCAVDLRIRNIPEKKRGAVLSDLGWGPSTMCWTRRTTFTWSGSRSTHREVGE